MAPLWAVSNSQKVSQADHTAFQKVASHGAINANCITQKYQHRTQAHTNPISIILLIQDRSEILWNLNINPFETILEPFNRPWIFKVFIESYCWWFRNPAFTSWGRYFIPLFPGFYTSNPWLFRISEASTESHPMSAPGWRHSRSVPEAENGRHFAPVDGGRPDAFFGGWSLTCPGREN